MPERRLPRDQRRELIVDAAEALFAENGYAPTRLEDVASASDVSKQLLQRHFGSKRDLLLAVVVRHRDGLLGRLTAPSAAEDLEQRLRERTDAWFGYIEEHPAAARLLFADVTGDPEIASFYAAMRDAAQHAVAEMLRAEDGLLIPDALLMPVAEMLRAGTVGLAIWWSDHREVPREEVSQLALEVWTGGLWSKAVADADDTSMPLISRVS
jgi:AcrR family transcriptional regulator